ncbi:MAG: helix-turn-helix transcriptional regulator [Oscillospiraceae bacterium]|nr:helix-turn-helix transcriptional regulator [Oscillospiraceae bacterium]
MFRIEKFKAALVENGLTVADAAAAMGISKQALYRKMNGESDFYREEIQAFRKLINRDNVDDIFFAE